MSAPMPVNRARADGRLVVIPECAVCGETHRHGAAGFKNGESTRVPHCHPDADPPPEYKIVVEGTES